MLSTRLGRMVYLLVAGVLLLASLVLMRLWQGEFGRVLAGSAQPAELRQDIRQELSHIPASLETLALSDVR